MKQNNTKQQGFSLLELLVAFTILAMSLTVLLNIFASGINTVTVAEDYNQAVQIAESLMAKTNLETPLKTGQRTGIALEKYHWKISVQPFVFTAEPNALTTSVTLFKIKVEVEWEHRQIKLVNLKLVNKTL
ncbi:Type II secretion system protein I [Patescibacteria group bacterium]|nr:Type II secretion system protein I [Patescibacteria group bacterium]